MHHRPDCSLLPHDTLPLFDYGDSLICLTISALTPLACKYFVQINDGLICKAQVLNSR